MTYTNVDRPVQNITPEEWRSVREEVEAYRARRAPRNPLPQPRVNLTALAQRIFEYRDDQPLVPQVTPNIVELD